MKPKHLLVLIGALAVLAVSAIPVLAGSRDGNDDGLPDRWEKKHHLSLNVDQAKRDQDGDHRRNRGEFRHGTDPRDADTDDDGVEDGAECLGHDSSADSDDDGISDDAERECHHHGRGDTEDESGDDHGSGHGGSGRH